MGHALFSDVYPKLENSFDAALQYFSAITMKQYIGEETPVSKGFRNSTGMRLSHACQVLCLCIVNEDF